MTFKVWRWLRGGHWEQWWVDFPVNARVWHRVEFCSRGTDLRPSALCRGRPICETHRRAEPTQEALSDEEVS